jgi:hypothetical protein
MLKVAEARVAKEVPSEHEMLASVVEACQFEYKDLQDSWRLLETKGQALTSVSGVFIAGAFAFARDLAAGPAPGTKFFLILAVGTLLLSTAYGVAALFVRAVRSPMSAGGTSKLVDDLLRISTPQDFGDRYCNYLRDQARAWEVALESFRAANKTKARFLAAGQTTLLVASAVVCGLVCVAIWSK